MLLQRLIEEYPTQFAEYAEKVLDSYFGNIFVTYQNEKILYVNKRMAASVHMSKIGRASCRERVCLYV